MQLSQNYFLVQVALEHQLLFCLCVFFFCVDHRLKQAALQGYYDGGAVGGLQMSNLWRRESPTTEKFCLQICFCFLYVDGTTYFYNN